MLAVIQMVKNSVNVPRNLLPMIGLIIGLLVGPLLIYSRIGSNTPVVGWWFKGTIGNWVVRIGF